MNSIDKLNTLNRIQETLKVDRNDIGALLELAALQEKADLKRKLLNRVLTLDPVNKTARAMLLKMDRAEMGENQLQLTPSPVSTAQYKTPGPNPALADELEKPLIFRFSLLHQILVYSLIAFTVYISLQVPQNGELLAVIGAFLVSLIIPLWFVSAVLEVSNAGIKFSRLFGIARWEIPWEEIESIQPTATGQGTKIITKEGKWMEVSAQMDRYSVIVEILCKIRPDLFSTPSFNTVSFAPLSHSDPAIFTEPKIFHKNSLIKYGVIFLAIIGCMVSLVALIIQPLVGLIAVIFALMLGVVELNTPHTVKVQGNRIFTQSILRQEEWTATQIKEISMRYTYSQRGFHKRNFIHVETVQGKAFRLVGFAGGDEILYGFLRNWWGTFAHT